MDFFNSKEYEWADIRTYLAGTSNPKMTGIQYKMSQEKELLYGEGGNAIGIQQGNRAGSGTLTMLRGSLDDMNDAAVAAGGKDVLDLEFDVVVRFRGSSDGSRKMRTNTLVRVQITEYETAYKQGDKKAEVALPIIFLDELNS